MLAGPVTAARPLGVCTCAVAAAHCRYCDLYTAKIENLLGVDAARHCFIPMRTVMPHEPLPIVPIGSAVDEVLPRLHIPDSEAPVP